MKNRLLILIVCLLTLTLALPAWAADDLKPQRELDGKIKQVWFWDGKEYALVDSGQVNNIYTRDSDGDWDVKMTLGGAQVFNPNINIFGVSAASDKLFMIAKWDDEIQVFNSTNGTDWRNINLNIPEMNDQVWLNPYGEYDLLVNTDRGYLVRHQDYNFSWNIQLSGTSAAWDQVVTAGNKVFAVIDGQLQVNTNLSSWRDTGFKVGKSIVDVSNYEEKGGKAVVSADYAQDATVAAFNPAQFGSWTLSTDGGNSWTVQDKAKLIMHKSSDPVTITAMALAEDVMFIGTANNYLLYSVDGGEKWHPIEISGTVFDLAYEDNVLLIATKWGLLRLDWQPEQLDPVTDPAEEPALPGDEEEPADPGDDPVPQQRDTISFVLGAKEYRVGNQVQSMDVATISQEGRIYLPVRYLALALGVPENGIEWVNPQVTLTRDATQVKLNVNSSLISVNGQQINANQPIIVDNRTLLPARWVAEAFGYTVHWDAPNKTMLIMPN